MARTGAEKLIYNGNAKLEYSTSANGTFTKVYAIKEWPDPDGDMSYIDTTDMDCVKRKKQMPGLQDATDYVFPIDLEKLDNEAANLYVLNQMEDSGTLYYWKWTLSTGLVYTFQSYVKTKIKGGGNEDLIGFDLILNPIDEPVRTVSFSTASV